MIFKIENRTNEMHEVGIESKNCAQFEDVIKIIITDPQLKR